jgi:iron complex outermembrane receptor protein
MIFKKNIHRYFFIFLFFSFIAFSQQKSSTSTITLKEVELTATRLETQKKLFPFSVSLINFEEEQIYKQQISLDEYLKNIPSLFSLNSNNFAQDLRISIRGFGSRAAFGIRGIKIIVDGIPETTPDGQGQIDNLPLGMIKKIEVIRGPSSSIFGNASGGVIYISTLDSITDGKFQFRSTLGSFGMKSYNAMVELKGSKTAAIIYQNISSSDGFREYSKFKQRIFNTKVEHRFSKKSKLNWQFNFTNSPLAQDPGGVNIESVKKDRTLARQQNIDFKTYEKIDHLKTGLRYEQNISNDLTWKNYIFYSFRDFYGKLPFENGGIIDLERNYYGLGSSFNFKKEFKSLKYNWQVGVESASQKDQRDRYQNLLGTQGSSNFSQLESFDNLGSYFLGNIQFKNTFIQSAVRYDYQKIGANSVDDQIIYNVLNPSIGLSYLFKKDNRLYISYSTSFEAPTLSELSSDPSGKTGLNTNLKPSRAKNYELGWKINGNSYIIETSFFYTNSTNEIIPYELEAYPGRSFYRNSGESSRKGIEIYFNKSWKKWDLVTSYSNAKYLFDNYIKESEDLSGNDLPGIPRKQGTIELKYNTPKGFKIQFNLNHVGGFYAEDENNVKINSYTLFQTQISKTFKYYWGNFSFSGGIINFFDVDYFDNIRINAFGRRFYEAAAGRNFYTNLTFEL